MNYTDIIIGGAALYLAWAVGRVLGRAHEEAQTQSHEEACFQRRQKTSEENREFCASLLCPGDLFHEAGDSRAADQ